MGVDFYAYSEAFVNECIRIGNDEPYDSWKQRREQPGALLGYVRESYHGVTHAIDIFAPETYGEGEDHPQIVRLDNSYVYIPSYLLAERIDAVKEACRQRAQDYYEKSNSGAPGWGKPDTIEDRDKYATQQIEAFENILLACQEAEKKGGRVFFYNSY